MPAAGFWRWRWWRLGLTRRWYRPPHTGLPPDAVIDPQRNEWRHVYGPLWWMTMRRAAGVHAEGTKR